MAIDFLEDDMKFFVQDVMIREGMKVPSYITMFSHDDVRNDDVLVVGDNDLFYIFSSIQTANYINRPDRNFVQKRRFVEYSRNFEGEYFKHHVWSCGIEPCYMLNETCIYLQFGKLVAMSDQIRMMFGDKIFIKPDSAAKTFTGFSCTIDELAFETMAMRQTSHINEHEMCMVTKHMDISDTEYRVWIVDSKPATAACYGWTDEIDDFVPDNVMKSASVVGNSMFADHYTSNFVADFCLLDGKPKLIELNVMATSGWYDGMDIDALTSALKIYNIDRIG